MLVLNIVVYFNGIGSIKKLKKKNYEYYQHTVDLFFLIIFFIYYLLKKWRGDFGEVVANFYMIRRDERQKQKIKNVIEKKHAPCCKGGFAKIPRSKDCFYNS